MRKPIIAGNWKMYKDVNEAVELANAIKRGAYDVDNVEMVVCPPSVDLGEVGEMLSDSNVGVGGQNCYWEKEGAFTGEVSVHMLKSVGCKYVIIGHSERRKYFGETDETVNLKVKSAIDGGLIPIMCVGETLEEREAGKTMEVVRTQVTGGLKGFSEAYIDTLIIAYEPVWAIGTGRTATPEQAQEVHAMIRCLLSEMYSEALSDSIRVLYGGSVKPDNVEKLMQEKDIDGGLIGGASLKAESFLDMVKTTSKLYSQK
ncbi:MAG: triose-phosphate isomerase [Candidatus Omnitrophica bacterium]|nr:triose-phosphate isomerase [Candidatus Omnitrophota bacterium]MDD5488128.1 triose-phosphate isomerase [Candidatus Omnitrophota bacterium]